MYQEMGKMNVLEAMEHMDAYEKGIAEGSDQFETAEGEIFTKRCDGEYVQRIVKFPKYLMAEEGSIYAVMTSYRDQCAVLVKEGFEDKTILKTWREKYPAPLYNMNPKVTIMVPMRDGVRLATDVYLPVCEEKVPTVGGDYGRIYDGMYESIINGKKIFLNNSHKVSLIGEDISILSV